MIRILLILIALLILYLPVALSSQLCLTKSEARKLWPKSHLYWYSTDHCWSNRRGPPKGLKVDPIKSDKIIPDETLLAKALIAVAQVKEDKQPAPDPWTNAQPLKVIEIIRPSIPVPVTPVEESPLPSLTPPSRISNLYAILGGAFFALLVALMITRRSYVKSSFVRLYQRITATCRKVSSACAIKRNRKSPVREVNIRDLIRRIDRGGYEPHFSPVHDSLTNIERKATPTPVDDSAIACWARSLRT